MTSTHQKTVHTTWDFIEAEMKQRNSPLKKQTTLLNI
jgi:hypothetical protein